MTSSRRLAALIAAAAIPSAVAASVLPTAAAPSPGSLTVGVSGAAPSSQSFSGGPITGSEDVSGSLPPPISCDQPACEKIPVTLKAPAGFPSQRITLTVTVNFDAAAGNPDGLTGLDAYILDGQGNMLAGDTLGSAPSVATVDKLDPGSYVVEVTGEAAAQNQSYTGTLEASITPLRVDIDPFASPLQFSPSTVVSPVILGGEPQISLERPVAQPKAGAGLDPRRGFVDWPVSSRTQIGTLWRTLDGGETYRQIVDLSCAQRQVPNCHTGGGGDTVNRVNNYDGTVLYGDQESLAQEAFASSVDHGDSFPVTRQTAVSSLGSGVDRQWISAVDAPGVMGGPFVPFELEGLFSYHVPDAGEYVAGVGTDGILRPAAAPVIPNVSQSGPSRVDVQQGSHGFGWFYQSYRDGNGFEVGVAPLSKYQDPTAFKVQRVTADTPQVFPWIALDRQGNLYATWVAGDGQLYYSVSQITDPRNDPTATPAGVPGTAWSAKRKVNPPLMGSTVFPEIVAGDPGRIAIVYMATPDHTGVSDDAPQGDNDAARWYTVVSESTDAMSAQPDFTMGYASHRIAHQGSICTSGTTCIATGGDRSLLDMIDITMDSDGRPEVVYCDNNNAFAREEASLGSQGSGFVKVAQQASGPSLLVGHGPYASTYPASYRAAKGHDATWPNTAAGTNLPSLDITGSGVSVDGGNLVARIDLGDTAFARDLSAYNSAQQAGGSTDPAATRMQYVLRWDTVKGESRYLAAEADASGTLTYFGGKLDSSNAVSNGNSPVAVAYRPQSGTTVTGLLSGTTLTLRAPLSQLGAAAGDRLVSVQAFSLAGPSDEVLSGEPETAQVLAAMREIDAAPPLDAQLVAAQGSSTQSTTGAPLSGGTTAPSGLPNTAPVGSPLAVLIGVPLALAAAVAGARRRRRSLTSIRLR